MSRSPGLQLLNEPVVHAAMRFAERAHHGQRRKFSGEPYVDHPSSVFTIVLLAGGSLNQQVAALLHDVVEDTPVTLDEILLTFGKDVTSIVAALTRLEGETYRDFVRRSAEHPEAWLVKRSDVLHNLSSLPRGHSLHERYIEALTILHSVVQPSGLDTYA